MGPLVPQWVQDTIKSLKERDKCDCVIVSPHWGPNQCTQPLLYIRQAAESLVDLGVDLVAGHSAHCFQGAWSHGHVLFDMGDFVDVSISPVSSIFSESFC